MTDERVFRPYLYRGTANYYDRFRVGYPKAMVDDLVARSRVTGRGRALDLACGTGQIAFAVQEHFAEVVAVDQERDMVELVRRKAAAAGLSHVRTVVSTAEDFATPDECFELVAIGNAFHRLRRQRVAERVLRWLEPGRCLALLWANGPWRGAAGWQKAMEATLNTWMARTAAHERVPADWERARKEHPDGKILDQAGFELAGSYSFPTDYEWTAETLIGFVYSTSVLPRAVLGDLAESFEADLRDALGASDPATRFQETIDFGYELARRPE